MCFWYSVSPLTEDDVLFSFSELFRHWKMVYYLLLLHKCLEYFGLSETTCFFFPSATPAVLLRSFHLCRGGPLGVLVLLAGYCSGGWGGSSQTGVTHSHLVVMVCKGTAAGKGPLAIRLSSGMLHVSLGFILCLICCEIHFILKWSHLSLHLVLIERVPYIFL